MGNSTIEGEKYWEERPVNDQRKDWRDGKEHDWIQEYWDSFNHPHRNLIIQALEKIEPFHDLLEVGCSAGPNLRLIRDRWPNAILYGIDLNSHAVDFARGHLPEANVFQFSVLNMPFRAGQFDCVLADASLMYVPPENIKEAMDKICEVATRAVVICDFESDSKEGKEVANHWGRDYGAWLKDYGFSVEKVKLTEQDWPSKNWSEHGFIWIATR